MSHSTYPIMDLTFVAAEDLRTYQYFLVELGSSAGTVQLHKTAHAYPIGILRNKPNTGETAVVRIMGVSEVAVYTGGIAVNAVVGEHNSGSSAYTPDGYADEAIATGIAIGRCIEASGTTAGNYATVVVSFVPPTVYTVPQV